MAYTSITQADMDAMIGSVGVEARKVCDHIDRVVEVVTSLGADPAQVLVSKGFTAAQAADITAAFGAGGLLTWANAFRGQAAIASGTNIQAKVTKVIGTALF